MYRAVRRGGSVYAGVRGVGAAVSGARGGALACSSPSLCPYVAGTAANATDRLRAGNLAAESARGDRGAHVTGDGRSGGRPYRRAAVSAVAGRFALERSINVRIVGAPG